MKIDFAREISLKILYKIDTENGYSNIVLDEYLNKLYIYIIVKKLRLELISVKFIKFLILLIYELIPQILST